MVHGEADFGHQAPEWDAAGRLVGPADFQIAAAGHGHAAGAEVRERAAVVSENAHIALYGRETGPLVAHVHQGVHGIGFPGEEPQDGARAVGMGRCHQPAAHLVHGKGHFADTAFKTVVSGEDASGLGEGRNCDFPQDVAGLSGFGRFTRPAGCGQEGCGP